MRILKVLFLSSLLVSTAFAEDLPLFDDAGYDAETDSIGKTEEISKIAILEQEVQNLTGRIEILEHNLQELQQNGVNNFVEKSSAPVVSGKSKVAPIASASPDPREEQREYDLALSTLKDGKHDEAEKLFSDYIKRHPNSKSLSNAYFWHAETFYRRNDFDKAAINFLKNYQKFPSSAKAPDALLKLALSLGEMKKNKEACSILKKLDDEFKKRSGSSIKRAYDAKIKYGCK